MNVKKKIKNLQPFFCSIAIRIKKPIKTKFRLPVFNWTALKPTQINGTVFNEIDDERVLEVRVQPSIASALCKNSLLSNTQRWHNPVTHCTHLTLILMFSVSVCFYLQELDLDKFEELFKTKAQGPVMDLSCPKNKVSQKVVNKVTLLDANRSKNLAITLRKAAKSTEEICKAIQM